MSSTVHVDTAVKSDILDCNAEVRRQIGEFLLELQDNPLPKDRKPMDGAAFYYCLRCGYYVSWEVIGDLVKFVSTGDTKKITVRILGVGRESPK